jgi:hypothetical protein
MITVMRGAVKGAGNPVNLQLIVKCADPPKVYEAILDCYGRAMGRRSRRAGETHLLLAKGLGFLDHRNVPTIGAGRTLLALTTGVPVPKAFILMQLLRKDRSFLVRFLSAYCESMERNIGIASDYAAYVLRQLWKEYPNELDSLGLQREQHTSPSALSHFLNPRLSLLRKLGVRDREAQRRLALEFSKYADQPLPDNSYNLLSRALYQKEPTPFISEKMIAEAYPKLKGISYASIVGLYDYLNQLTIPATSVTYDKLFDYLTKSEKFALHPLETLREGMFKPQAA